MLVITGTAILPVIILAFLIGTVGVQSLRVSDEERLLHRAIGLAHVLDEELDGFAFTLKAAVAPPSTGNGSADAAIERDDTPARLKHLAEFLGGSIVLAPPSLDTVATTIETALVFPVDNKLVAARITIPVADPVGQPSQVELTVPLRRLTRLLHHPSKLSPDFAMILDPQNRVVATSGPFQQMIGRQVVLDLATDAVVAGSLDSGPPVLLARAPIAMAAGWRAVAGQDLQSLRSSERALIIWCVEAAALAAIASLMLALLLSSWLSRPLRALVAYVGAVAIGGERPREQLPPLSIAEFEALRLGIVRANAVLLRRMAAERMALREARTGHELLNSVVNATAECIYVKDLELRYVLVNRAALLFGLEHREEWQVLGRTAADLFPPGIARRIEIADRAVLSSGRMTSFEQDVQWSENPSATRWLWVTVTPWQDAEGRVVGVVSVSRDITEQRAAGIRLRGMQADLLRATRLSAMGAMASGLAHELNQPLAAATNYLNASARLLDRAGSVEGATILPANFQAARGAVSDAAQQMLRAGAIVRRLRDFVGRGEAELQSEDVGELIRGVVDLARADGITRGIVLRMALAPEDAVVLVDRIQIQQVLLNLIRNAAEAIGGADGPNRPPGVIVLATTLHPTEPTWIDVIDNGPGLAPEIAERLFQPFVSTKPTGMGIGLAICHTIVEGHGGRLMAEAHPTGGMRFRIALPPAPKPGQNT